MQKKIMINLFAVSLLGILLSTIGIFIGQAVNSYGMARELSNIYFNEIEEYVNQNNQDLQQSLSDAKKFIKDISTGTTGYLFLLDKENSLILSHPNSDLEATSLVEPLDTSGFIRLDGQTAVYFTKDIGNRAVVSVFPVFELYSQRTFPMRMYMLFMVSIIGLICFIVNSYLKRSVIADIQSIIMVLDKITQGCYNMTADVRSNKELSQLSDGINHMVQSINAKISEVVAIAFERERTAHIINTIDAGIIMRDRNSVVLGWNYGAETILGYKADEVVGKISHDNPDDDSEILILEQRLRNGEHITHIEIESRHKDGRRVICSSSYSPMFDENGEFDGYVAVFHDITESKLAEEKSRRLAAIVAISDAGVVVKDKDGKVVEWNIGAQNILGYTQDEILGKTTHYYAPESAHEGIDNVSNRLHKGEHIAHVEVIRKHKDGRNLYCSSSYTPIFNDGREYVGSVSVFHDITESKLAEEKARNLAAIVAISDAGIAIKDKDGVLTEWNIGAENIFGYKRDELIGKTTHFYTPESGHSEVDEIEEKIRAGENIERMDVVRRHKSGALVYCSSSYTPIFGENGDYTGSVAVFHDISDKKEMEKRLREAISETEEKNKTILSNLVYSSKIQQNLLPSEQVFREWFADYSIIWKPKDIVGGDIYWLKGFSGGVVLCVCDCTGHGTAGALLSMLLVSSFESIVNERNYQDTAEIVWRLEQRIVGALHTSAPALENKERDLTSISNGCDLAVLYIDNDGSVTISAGNTYVFICDGNEVKQIKGQRIFIGEGALKSKNDVHVINIPSNKNNKYYVASDGLFDQIGGPRSIPYGYGKFKRIILENHNERQSVITNKIWENFENYRENQVMRDDIELVAFKPYISN